MHKAIQAQLLAKHFSRQEVQGRTKSTALCIECLHHVVQEGEMLRGAAPHSAFTVDMGKHLSSIFIKDTA